LKARRLSKPGLRVGLDARLAFRRGVGTYTAQLAMALARVENGLQLFLLNAPPLLKERLQGSRARFLDVASVNPILYEQFQLPSMAHRESLDLLHYTDNSGAVFASAPYVLTLHDAMMMRPGAETHDGATLRQRAVGFYKRWVACPSGRAARLVLTVSEYSKRDISERMGLSPEKIRVVPEGVDAGAFAQPRRSKKHANAFPVVLVQGAVDKRKNIPGVLKTAAFLKGRGKTP